MAEGYESIPNGYHEPPCFECSTCYGTGEIDTEEGQDFEPCQDCDGLGYIEIEP